MGHLFGALTQIFIDLVLCEAQSYYMCDSVFFTFALLSPDVARQLSYLYLMWLCRSTLLLPNVQLIAQSLTNSNLELEEPPLAASIT